MSSAGALFGAVVLGVLLVEARGRLRRSSEADVAVMAPLVALLAVQPDGSALGLARLSLLIFAVGRMLVATREGGPGDAPNGNLHLLAFVPALAAGSASSFDLWSWFKTATALGFAALVIGQRATVTRWAAVIAMVAPFLGRV